MFIRRVFAWPIGLLGYGLTIVGGWCIHFAAWAMDIDLGNV